MCVCVLTEFIARKGRKGKNNGDGKIIENSRQQERFFIQKSICVCSTSTDNNEQDFGIRWNKVQIPIYSSRCLTSDFSSSTISRPFFVDTRPIVDATINR